MQDKEIVLDDEAINRLKKKIIIKERKNLMEKSMNDQQMIEWIKRSIEEEVKCCLNQ